MQPLTATITGGSGEMSINGGGWTVIAQDIYIGDTIRVRVPSPAHAHDPEPANHEWVSVTIGGVESTFDVYGFVEI